MGVTPETINNRTEHSASPLVMKFAVELVELADKYDSLDHSTGDIGELQRHCHTVRELARLIVKIGPGRRVDLLEIAP